MRFISIIMLGLIVLLQYRLWFGKHSIPDYRQMKQQVDWQYQQNEKLMQKINCLKPISMICRREWKHWKSERELSSA